MSRDERQPPKDHVIAILAALEEIESHFEWQGISDVSENERDGSDEQAVSEDDLDDSEASATKVFDAEDIEIAIDAFLSRLIHAEIVQKSKGGGAPSMASVFQRMFGDDHEVAKMAEEFEEHVVGYFGWVSSDDMDEALNSLNQIKALLTTLKEAANG